MKREKLKVENLYIQKFYLNTLNDDISTVLDFLATVVGDREARRRKAKEQRKNECAGRSNLFIFHPYNYISVDALVILYIIYVYYCKKT